MRPTMISSALAVVDFNHNRQNRNLRVFEFGRTYRWEDGTYREKQHLALVLSGDEWGGNWIQPNLPSGFYYLKSVVVEVLSSLNIDVYKKTVLDDDAYDCGIVLQRGLMQLYR